MSAHAITHLPPTAGGIAQALAHLRRRLAEAIAPPVQSRAEIARRQATKARSIAERMQGFDPRVAAEILAAADRHDSQFER